MANFISISVIDAASGLCTDGRRLISLSRRVRLLIEKFRAKALNEPRLFYDALMLSTACRAPSCLSSPMPAHSNLFAQRRAAPRHDCFVKILLAALMHARVPQW